MSLRHRFLIALLGLPVLSGCGRFSEGPELVWGVRGVRHGELINPRAIAIDASDHLYLVDMTARLQVYDAAGQYLGPTWRPPDYRNGRPSGLSIDRDGHLLVSDSHYNCLRVYNAAGELLRTIGGQAGTAPGQLSYISDAVQDADGFYYIAEFGDNHRISKFDAAGHFVKCWGEPGSEPHQMSRIRALALGPDGLLYAADACNHRIVVYNKNGKLIRWWGVAGPAPGQLFYPYDLAFSRLGPPCLYVVEYGNHRVQKFTFTGQSLGCWGGNGRAPGKLCSPWALAVDSLNRVHVVDSANDRVQRVSF